MTKQIITFLFVCSFFVYSFGTNSNPNEPRILEAKRISERPVIDGKIDPVFKNTQFKATDFTTLDPVPGLPSSYRTEVSIVYDDQAVFIAAKLYDDDPENIIKDLSPRDRFSNTDYFGITFDPYKTGLTGYTFEVSAAGVQRDAKTFGDDNDSSWNDVWQSEVSIDEDGWSVEMAIPYSALRFPTGQINDWNINIIRSVRSTRETSYWNPINPAVDGFLTQMGTLKDIKNIDAPLRLSLTPYVGIQGSVSPSADGLKPNSRFNGGLDLKYGINDAFTLDMILIPDFSQVRSDVQVLNLSPFEIQFDENRPFFTEGLELFQTADVVYTRRIGGSNGFLRSKIANQDDFSEFTKLPGNNLVNATKLSGRSNSNTGLGFFNAVEVPTYAEYIDINGETQRAIVNPFTNYNVVVAEQALKNNSRIGLINTNVLRIGESTDANVTALSWNLRNNKQSFDFIGSYGLSQRFSSDIPVDLGYKLNFDTGKISGAWTYRGGMSIESARYNPNDLGFLFSPNEQNFYASIRFTKFKPKHDKVANYNISNVISYESLYAPNKFVGIFTNHQYFIRLKSFNAFGAWLRTAPLGFKDYFEPRREDFSKFLLSEPSALIGGFVSSDYRKPIAIDIRTNLRKYTLAERYNFDISVAPRFRLSSRVFIVPRVAYQKAQVDRGYVFVPSLSNVSPTYDIVIGERNINTFNNSINGQFNINNKASLNLQVDHFFSSVKYSDFKLLQNNGKLTDSAYAGIDENGNPIHDTNFNFFTINTVFTWRFAPGSDLIISYKSDLSKVTEEARYLRNVRELGNFYERSGVNLKALYYLDINRLLTKKEIKEF